MYQQNQEQFSRIAIRGFKSIKECDIELGSVNVLIGSNGAGKSNFVSILELMQSIVSGRLSYYAAKKGANFLFFNGPKVSNSIAVEFYFGDYLYSLNIEITDNNSLYIERESIGQRDSLLSDGGYGESKMVEWYSNPKTNSIAIQTILNWHWQAYHFHDTSQSSNIKMTQNISNAVSLHKDAGNLAAFLYRLKRNYPAEYNDILNAVQMIAPFLKDFVLEPEDANSELINLRWQKKDLDDVFSAAQFSDGTLRFICLATLLLQPIKLQPATIFIDEPELGLHPFAITILAEMVQKAAVNKQIVLATQSVELLDNFDADDIIVVDDTENGSDFKRLDSEHLALWLENDYTLGELWNKNIFGGRP